ncbi:tumor necrosis factor ligand superfamily member 6 [Brachyistius frenatus]|uniref:tumor necrosis factor ligand superfamily member 6 n=1 Tax=Brachyistius frenatus TaxID=100188 RepID=UPI0037E79318
MSCDQSQPFPQVFLVDSGGGPQHSAQPPHLIPCWSFPPAQERVRNRGKSRGCMGINPGLALIVLLLFMLVFVALGLQAYQILTIQRELADVRKVQPAKPEFKSPQKQIGNEAELNGDDQNNRPGAHVIGRIEEKDFRKTLRWEPKTGQAFTSEGVAYHVKDGALQVNQTGLYHIYSRVAFLFKSCSPTSEFGHSVFVMRHGHSSPLVLMKAHRVGFCSRQQGHAWTTESYLGSAQKLKKYDKVYVNVSHPQELSHTHDANFFGLYKV